MRTIQSASAGYGAKASGFVAAKTPPAIDAKSCLIFPNMKTPWFRRWGWFHRPASPAGAVCVLLAVAFAVNVFVAVDRRSHSVSDTLYGIFPFWAPTFLLLVWIASQTSDDSVR